MDYYKKIIGGKIRARRLELGIKTQEALGRLLDVDQSYVSRWERGLHLPEGKHRDALLRVLKADESLLDVIIDKYAKGKKIADMTGDEVVEFIKERQKDIDRRQKEQSERLDQIELELGHINESLNEFEELIRIARRLDRNSLLSLLDDARDYATDLGVDIETPRITVKRDLNLIRSS